jgi:hypothetical protein
MKIAVRRLANPQGTRWQVRLGQHAVSFRSEAEAHAFIDTLESRLRAPHILPALAQKAAG